MSRQQPTHLSLFSGIGGLDLGLERAGWQVIGQVENDPFCQLVLAKHWPQVPRWGDIREVQVAGLPRADLVAAGFPCQPVSNNGRRQAQQDPRWLWPHTAAVVRQLRPRWVLLENVPGLLARGMGDVLGDLAAIGYDAEWDCIPAATVGAPHLRERVFVVAYPAGEGLQGPQPTGQLWGRRLLTQRDRWGAEPRVARVANGVPGGVDRRVQRTGALGRAVVPAVGELIGRLILEAWT